MRPITVADRETSRDVQAKSPRPPARYHSSSWIDPSIALGHRPVHRSHEGSITARDSMALARQRQLLERERHCLLPGPNARRILDTISPPASRLVLASRRPLVLPPFTPGRVSSRQPATSSFQRAVPEGTRSNVQMYKSSSIESRQNPFIPPLKRVGFGLIFL
jgi:hypothetical protein